MVFYTQFYKDWNYYEVTIKMSSQDISKTLEKTLLKLREQWDRYVVFV